MPAITEKVMIKPELKPSILAKKAIPTMPATVHTVATITLKAAIINISRLFVASVSMLNAFVRCNCCRNSRCNQFRR